MPSGKSIMTVDGDGNLSLYPVDDLKRSLDSVNAKAKAAHDRADTAWNHANGAHSHLNDMKKWMGGHENLSWNDFKKKFPHLYAYVEENYRGHLQWDLKPGNKDSRVKSFVEKIELAAHLAENSVQRGGQYWLRMPAFGNKTIGTNDCDLKGDHNDKAAWCDRGGSKITLS